MPVDVLAAGDCDARDLREHEYPRSRLDQLLFEALPPDPKMACHKGYAVESSTKIPCASKLVITIVKVITTRIIASKFFSSGPYTQGSSFRPSKNGLASSCDAESPWARAWSIVGRDRGPWPETLPTIGTATSSEA